MDIKNNELNKLKIDAKWLEWFVGFTDAEGSFQVYPKKRILKSGKVSKYNVGCSFHLSLHKREQEVIENIRDRLHHIGTIYTYKNRNEIRLAVNDIKGLFLLVNSIFEVYPLKTKSQISRYNLLKHYMDNNVKEFNSLQHYNDYKFIILSKINTKLNEIKDITNKYNLNNWIVGMINGEGCFYLAGKAPNYKRNFVIEHTDMWSLTEIRRTLNIKANVLERSARIRDLDKNRKITYQLVVVSEKDIAIIIDFLDNKATARKQTYTVPKLKTIKKNRRK